MKHVLSICIGKCTDQEFYEGNYNADFWKIDSFLQNTGKPRLSILHVFCLNLLIRLFALECHKTGQHFLSKLS